MGLPGSGKTYLAQRIVKLLNADWFNADKIRGAHNDWDFSNVGIIRQVKRMKKLADNSKKKFVVADFICPIKKQIEIFKPNFIIWMDTIKKSKYPRMNKIFSKPKKYDLRLKEKNLKINLMQFEDKFPFRLERNFKNIHCKTKIFFILFEIYIKFFFIWSYQFFYINIRTIVGNTNFEFISRFLL